MIERIRKAILDMDNVIADFSGRIEALYKIEVEPFKQIDADLLVKVNNDYRFWQAMDLTTCAAPIFRALSEMQIPYVISTRVYELNVMQAKTDWLKSVFGALPYAMDTFFGLHFVYANKCSKAEFSNADEHDVLIDDMPDECSDFPGWTYKVDKSKFWEEDFRGFLQRWSAEHGQTFKLKWKRMHG